METIRWVLAQLAATDSGVWAGIFEVALRVAALSGMVVGVLLTPPLYSDDVPISRRHPWLPRTVALLVLVGGSALVVAFGAAAVMEGWVATLLVTASLALDMWAGVSLAALGVAGVSFLQLGWLHRRRGLEAGEVLLCQDTWLPTVAVRWFAVGIGALLVGLVAGLGSVYIPLGHTLMQQGYALAQAARTSGIPWGLVEHVALGVAAMSMLGIGGLWSSMMLFPLDAERPRWVWQPRIIAVLLWISVGAWVVALIASALAE